MPKLVILHEHPEWQKPLFAELARRGLDFAPFDLKRAAFDVDEIPRAKLYFNQASPSAYLRGNTRAVPLALSLMRTLELGGARVLNGSHAFAVELSKSVQGALMRSLGIPHPRSVAFNDPAAVSWSSWPALLKPEQGGSGARMFLLESLAELHRTLEVRPDLWEPDGLLLLQEYFPTDRGIVRLEYLGGKLLYAMRVISHGAFNLCPSPVCNPADGDGVCAVPETKPTKPVEFLPYPEVPDEAVAEGARIVNAAQIDVGAVEYLETVDGQRKFYDVNANSNLRPSIGQAFGFDPFVRVADFLERELSKA